MYVPMYISLVLYRHKVDYKCSTVSTDFVEEFFFIYTKI